MQVTYTGETCCTKVDSHPGWGWGWEGVRSHHIIQNDCQFKTYELVISGIFVVMILDQTVERKQNLEQKGLLSGSGGDQGKGGGQKPNKEQI